MTTTPASVVDAFLQTAARHGQRVALRADHDCRYRQLDEISQRIAAALRRRGVGRGSIVGLHLRRSPLAIAAILGVLRAGAAYLPFDTGYPQPMLRRIAEDGRPALLLVDGAESGGFWQGPAVDVATLAAEDPSGFSETAIGPDDAAYVMYTSGSTGTPKGVVVPHRGILRLVCGADYADFGPEHTFLQLAPLAFDASTFEIWGALLNGGTLALAPAGCTTLDDIAQTIARYRVTTLWLTAGLFHLMVDHRLDGLRPLRQLLAGGDVLSPPHVAKALAALPDCSIINGYGPTENTTFTCCYRIPRPLRQGPIPIGLPIAGTVVHVLDEAGQPVAEGDSGELHAGGDGVALGYLGRPDLTAQRFVRNPFGPGLLYRSGDRVRRMPDGVLEFLGRVDRQVKISGKRVELDDLEASLRASGRVDDAAVVAREIAPAQQRIEAYVCGALAEPEALRKYLQAQLPDYMVPSRIVRLDTLPLSATGKVDRRRLLEQHGAPKLASASASADPVERALTDIWMQALGRTDFGRDDNFFDLGGSSLQLLAVHASIRRSLKPDAALLELFRHPTLRGQAQWISGEAALAPPSLDARQRALRGRAALQALRDRGRPGR